MRNDQKNQPNHSLSVMPTLLLECSPLILLAFAAITRLTLQVGDNCGGRGGDGLPPKWDCAKQRPGGLAGTSPAE